jgi:hypothetical protein
MNNIGIVGSEGSKFTKLGMDRAITAIRTIISDPEVKAVCSGECHLGGIDMWTHEVAESLGKPFTPFPPATQKWEGGYKQRNLQIAGWSDIVWCITVDKLPSDYKGMVFNYCYHCLKSSNGLKEPHIKSGGCWTALKCKDRKWLVINNE